MALLTLAKLRSYKGTTAVTRCILASALNCILNEPLMAKTCFQICVKRVYDLKQIVVICLIIASCILCLQDYNSRA